MRGVSMVLAIALLLPLAYAAGTASYASNTGICTLNKLNCPKVRNWNAGIWGAELELPTAGSPVWYTLLRYAPGSQKRVLITLSDDGYLDGYVCSENCTNPAAWIVSNNIGKVWSVAKRERRFSLAFSKNGDALLVYAVENPDSAADLAYKILPVTANSFAGIVEQYINDDGQTDDTQYGWIELDSNPKSDELIAAGFDTTHSDINAWVWNGKRWGDRLELTPSATATGGGEALAVRYAADGSKGMVISADGTAGEVQSAYWNGKTWIRVPIGDLDPSDRADTQWLTLKADPNSDDLQAVSVNSGSDLDTMYWNGAMWQVTPNIDTTIDAPLTRPADFAWLNGTGLLAWDTDAAGTTLSSRVCSPQCTGTPKTLAGYSGTGAWVTLLQNVGQVVGLRLQSTFDLGAFSAVGDQFTNAGATALTVDTTVTATESYSMDFTTVVVPLGGNVNLQMSLKNHDGQDIDADIDIGEAVSEEAYQSVYKGKKPKHEGQIKRGNYHALVKPTANLVKEIEVFNLSAENDLTGIVDIDDMPETAVPKLGKDKPNWIELYALNPQAQFESAVVTLTAKGSALYKCKEWDFASRTCGGSWQFLQKLTPGENYTVRLDAADPGYGEIPITDAVHLDSTYNFISNVYNEVKAQDNVWSEHIPEDEYIRATFSQALCSGNVVNLIARAQSGTTSHLELFEGGTTNLVGQTGTLSAGSQQYDVELQNLPNCNPQIDIKVVNTDNPPNRWVEFDYIHDQRNSIGAEVFVDYFQPVPPNLVTNNWTTTNTTTAGAAWNISTTAGNNPGRAKTSNSVACTIAGGGCVMGLKNAINTTKAANITVNFTIQGDALDAGEFVRAFVWNSTKGVKGWIKIFDFTSGGNGQNFANAIRLWNSTCINSICNTNEFMYETFNISFACGSSATTEPCYVDNVTIRVLENMTPTARLPQPVAKSTFQTDGSIPLAINASDDMGGRSISSRGISLAVANVTLPDGTYTYVTLSPPADQSCLKCEWNFTSTFSQTAQAGLYNVTFLVNDTNNNENWSVITNFTLTLGADAIFPNVSYINSSGGTPLPDTPVNITANVTDNRQLSWVFASVRVPNGTKLNVTMLNSTVRFNTTQQPTNFSIRFNDTSQLGAYTVIVAANDTTNNMNDTVTAVFTVATPPSTCGSLTTDTILNADVSAAGDCFTFDANYVTLNCDGHTVTYATSKRGDGAVAVSKQGINITNCIFHAGGVGTPFNIGVNFTTVSDSIIRNTTIGTNGTTDNYGISITTLSTNNTVINNTIFTNGSGVDNYGIYLSGRVFNNTISSNNIDTRGLSSSNIGISLGTDAAANNITDNTISTNGTTTDYGILVTTRVNTTRIENNSIFTEGLTAGSNYGIQFTGIVKNSAVVNNTVWTDGATTNNWGIQLAASSANNTISSNAVHTNGGSNLNYGIYLATAVQNNITDNVVFTNGTTESRGIVVISSAKNNRIENNTVSTWGKTGGNNDGVYMITTQEYNSIINNTFFTSGAASPGIYLSGSIYNTTVQGNYIRTNGSTRVHGIYLLTDVRDSNITDNIIITNTTTNASGIILQDNIFNVRVENNTVSANGRTGGNNWGILIDGPAANNTIIANRISTNGTAVPNDGIRLVSARNITFNYNNITIIDSDDYPIYSIASNGTFNNTLIISKGPWINTSEDTQYNFTSTTFQTPNGSILFPNFTLYDRQDIRLSALNISYNRTFVNTTNLTFLADATATITLNLSLTPLTNPRAMVDAADTGTFSACAGDVCAEQGFSNNIFTFSVTHWTAYAAAETPAGGGDTVFPNVSYLRPPAGTEFGRRTPVNISVNVTDDVRLSVINASVQVPNGTKLSLIMFNNTNGVAWNTTNPPDNFTVLFNDTTQLGTYTIRISANDTTNNVNDTITTTFDVTSVVAITVTTNSVTFPSSLGLDESDDTTDGTPVPFTIRNDGNVPLNVTINATRLFNGTASNTSSYRFKCRENEGPNCPTGSPSSFTDMPLDNATLTNLTVVFDFPYEDTNDSRFTDIYVDVPSDEPGGSKSSVVTYTASEASWN